MSDVSKPRTIVVTIDGEPADHRTLDLLERGIEALTKGWDTAYETLSDEMPSQDYFSTKTLEHVVAFRDELVRLENDLNTAKRDFLLRRDFGVAK